MSLISTLEQSQELTENEVAQQKCGPNHKPEEQEDASSTGSCSCEDHSSVEEQSEDLNEGLDYDEDSNQSTKSPHNLDKVVNPVIPVSPTSCRKKSPSPELFNLSPQSLDTQHASKKIKIESDQLIENSTSRPQLKSFINKHQDETESVRLETRKRSSRGREKSDRSYSYLLKHFFKDACYFQVKSVNHDNVELSKSMNIWSTPAQNEVRFNAAFNEHRNVILIFSVQQSGAFQGFARMVSESRPTTQPIPWILPERFKGRSLTGAFGVEWLCRKELPFHCVDDLYNSFNESKPVKIARDGQQVEPRVGKKLCKLFPEDDRKLLLDSISTLKDQISQRKRMRRGRDKFYPMINRREFPAMPRGPDTSDMFGVSARPEHVNHISLHQKSYRPMPNRHRPAGDTYNYFQGPAYGPRSMRLFADMSGLARHEIIHGEYSHNIQTFHHDQPINHPPHYRHSLHGYWPQPPTDHPHPQSHQRPPRHR